MENLERLITPEADIFVPKSILIRERKTIMQDLKDDESDTRKDPKVAQYALKPNKSDVEQSLYLAIEERVGSTFKDFSEFKEYIQKYSQKNKLREKPAFLVDNLRPGCKLTNAYQQAIQQWISSQDGKYSALILSNIKSDQLSNNLESKKSIIAIAPCSDFFLSKIEHEDLEIGRVDSIIIPKIGLVGDYEIESELRKLKNKTISH